MPAAVCNERATNQPVPLRRRGARVGFVAAPKRSYYFVTEREVEVAVSELCDLIFDWNTVTAKAGPRGAVSIADETLRDGLQSPSVINPDIGDKLKILHLMEDLGIQSADIGL